MKIIVDAMGGDNAPVSNVRGALSAVRELGVEVVLVGRGEEILKVLKEDGVDDLPPGVEIAHASEVVEMCDNPATAFKEKKDSSLTVGLNLLKNGAADAFVSAGSTGAILSAATLLVKRIRGIRRAALAPVVPTGAGGAVLIDCGATAECTPEYLLQFAFMGSYYAERVLGRPEPKVGLLNIGVEESKGMDLQREAYALLKQAGEAGRIHFVGNVEAREAVYGRGGRDRHRRLLRQYFPQDHGRDRRIFGQAAQGHVPKEPADQARRPDGLRRAEAVQKADGRGRGGRHRAGGHFQAGHQGPRLLRRLRHQERHPAGGRVRFGRHHRGYYRKHRAYAPSRRRNGKNLTFLLTGCGILPIIIVQ